MKAKLKGQSGVKGLLLLHGEKLMMAVFVLAAGYLIYSSVRVQGLPDQYEPAKLETEVRQTSSKITGDTNTWERFVREHPDEVRLSSESIKTEVFSVDPASYGDLVLNPRVHNNIQPRTDPAYLAAADVRATSGADLFAINDPTRRSQYELKLQEEEAKREQKRQREQEKEQKEQKDGRTGERRGGRRTAAEETRAGFDPDHPNRWTVTRQAGGASLSGGETVELNRWVSVVAKVPIKKQMQQYRQAFENASGGFNPNADVPLYVGAVIQRAEYVPGTAPESIAWKPVPVTDARSSSARVELGSALSSGTLKKLSDAAEKWIGGASYEIVSPHYLSPSGCLVYPLPPIVGRDWGREVTHPDIPLVTDPAKEETSSSQPQSTPTTPLAGGSADGFGVPAGTSVRPPVTQGYSGGAGLPAGGENVRARRPSSPPESLAEPPAPAPVARQRRTSSGGPPTGGPGTSTPAARSAPVASGGPPPAEIEFYLLRFFDFSAEPGKRYTYRIQLVLSDPNLPYFNTPSALEPKVLARLKTHQDAGKMREMVPVFTPWSQPSPPVGIPLQGRVRLAAISAGDDPRVDLVVDGFGVAPGSGNWVQASKIKESLSRGSVVNFAEDTEYLLESRTHVDRFDGKFNFVTGITVLDARGGEKVGRDITVPSRVLLMGPSGDLKIRRELDDAADVQLYRDIFTKPKPAPQREAR